MEEKNLTDEEIIKALECCATENRENKPCLDCPYFIKHIDCVPSRRHEKDLLDLINRQKAEIERLTSLYDGNMGFMTSSIGDLPLSVEGLRKAVDEISRLLGVQAELQELNAKYYNEAKDLRRENSELQKQVDELMDKLGKVLSTVGLDEYQQSKAVEQAVKDTAKEIFGELDLFFKGTTFRQGYEFKKIMEKLKEMAKNYDVEVDYEN